MESAKSHQSQLSTDCRGINIFCVDTTIKSKHILLMFISILCPSQLCEKKWLKLLLLFSAASHKINKVLSIQLTWYIYKTTKQQRSDHGSGVGSGHDQKTWDNFWINNLGGQMNITSKSRDQTSRIQQNIQVVRGSNFQNTT